MGTTARRLMVMAALAAVLGAAGCSKDESVTSTATTTPVTASSGGGAGTTEPDDADSDKDKGSGDYAEVCAIIEEIDQADDDSDTSAGLALFEEARDAGPEELADHWDTLSDILGELDSLGETDEAMTRAFELLADPAFLEAAAAIDDFAEEECGLDISLDPAEEDATGGRLGDDEIGAPTDTTDPDEDPTSIDALQAHLEAEYGTESWWPVLDDATSWGSQGTGGDVQWTINLSNTNAAALSATELEAACDAMADYLDTYEEGDVSVEIVDADDAVLVSRAPGEACAAA